MWREELGRPGCTLLHTSTLFHSTVTPPARNLLRAAKEGMQQAVGGSRRHDSSVKRDVDQKGGREEPSSVLPSAPQTLDECVAQVEAELATLGQAIPDISLFR